MLEPLYRAARQAQPILAHASTAQRNRVLTTMADLLARHESRILAANREDCREAASTGLDGARQARLTLSEDKIAGLINSLHTVANCADPLGQGRRWTLPNGLVLSQVTVPLGVIGIIYESRPGVTIEVPALALKSGNALLLRGGREARLTNQALTSLWHEALAAQGWPADLIQLIEDPSRALAVELMHLDGLDLLIPRGGAALIQAVTQQATVPVIETGVGNCHLYVDQHADLDQAVHLLLDGKMGNPSVCNALETVLVHRDVKQAFFARAVPQLQPFGLVWHADLEAQAEIPEARLASEIDWKEEYLDAHLAAKVVGSLDEALAHIARYGSGHSEAIATEHYPTGQEFLRRVDAAVVYWNASTRFSDGFQFGFGAEVGISTQKLHARGPMGLQALTTTKTLGYGSGQTRDL